MNQEDLNVVAGVVKEVLPQTVAQAIEGQFPRLRLAAESSTLALELPVAWARTRLSVHLPLAFLPMWLLVLSPVRRPLYAQLRAQRIL